MDSSPVSSKRHPGQIVTVSFLLACIWFSTFQINTQLSFFCIFFKKMITGVHFAWPKIHFWKHFFLCNFFLYKMASDDHYGWPKITFYRISHHFRSIRKFNFLNFFLTKWPPATILDDCQSLSIAFLAISYQYATFCFEICSQNDPRQPFWITENHFRSHFSPFQINAQLLFF